MQVLSYSVFVCALKDLSMHKIVNNLIKKYEFYKLTAVVVI